MSDQTKKICGIVLVVLAAVLVMLGNVYGILLFVPGFALIHLASPGMKAGGYLDENEMLKEKPQDYPDLKPASAEELLPVVKETFHAEASVLAGTQNADALSFEYLYRIETAVHSADADRLRKNLMKKFSGAFNAFCMDEHTVRVLYLPA